MRRLLGIFILLAVPVFAQRGGGARGGGGGMRGSIGGGMRGGGMPGGRGIGQFRGGVGAFRGGVVRRPVFRSNFGFRGFYRSFYPGWYGFGLYDPFFYESPDAYYYGPGAYGYGYNGSASANPPVMIVQNMAPAAEPPPEPEVREYTSPPPQPPTAPQAQSSGPSLYLVAFQDGIIRAALTYWVEDRTLHYIDVDHKERQAPLSTVDRTLSERLNRERNVPFHLPN